jgi:hypothetical protein
VSKRSGGPYQGRRGAIGDSTLRDYRRDVEQPAFNTAIENDLRSR